MSHKRPLEAVPPEQEAAPSPTKRLRRTVLLWMEKRRSRAVTVEQMAGMVRQAQLDVAKLLMLLMVLLSRLCSMERLLLELPNTLQRLLADQLGAFQSSFMGSIEDKIRSVVQTENQVRQVTSLPNGVYELPRPMLNGFPGTEGVTRVVKLRFVDGERPKDPLYTGCPVQWQNGKSIKVAIFENETQIMDGDLSKLQIEIIPVHADFFTHQEDFTKEEFNKQIYTYKGKESVLTTVNLKNGKASLGSFSFTESSYRKKLRLTARVKRQDLPVSVQEAITDPFVVKDRRSASNEKSYVPSKEDAVHRLKKISPKGKRCIDLAGKRITTVKHLMRHLHKDKSGLQKLTGMKKEDWSTMIKHAATCDPGDEIYSYRVAGENFELFFNDFYDLVGVLTNGVYVPVSDLDQFQQLNVNNWKKSAYKKFDELESSGGLNPDYFMNNGRPVRAVPLNNDAGPSVQPTATWHYLNDIAAQHEFGDQHPNGFISRAELLSNNEAGPSKQQTLPFSQHTYEQALHQGLGQHDPSMPQNVNPYYLSQGNILHNQGSSSAQPTIPSHKFLPVPQDGMIPGASLTGQHNEYLSFSTTDAAGTSCLVTDGVTQETSSLNPVPADISSGLLSVEFQELEEWLNIEADEADQGIAPANNELPNSNSPFHGYGHDVGSL